MVAPPLVHPGTAASAELRVHHRVTVLLKESDVWGEVEMLWSQGGGC